MNFIDANNVPYQPNKWLTYDDVSLVPQYSDIPSRNDSSISLSTHFTPRVKIATPIVSAPMSCVTEAEMAIIMNNCGGAGILHRFYESAHGKEKGYNKFISDIQKLVNLNIVPAFSIGAAKENIEIVKEVLAISKSHVIVCIDVANGHTQIAIDAVRRLRDNFKDKVEIVAGNVCTPIGVQRLVAAGVDAIRVGIGGGSFCTTRVVTGHGTPQLTTIMHARKTINSMQANATLIADGGIRNSGDILKAVAAGADCVMIGGLLTPSSESPKHNLSYSEAEGHRVYGESSRVINQAVGKRAASEGASVLKESKGSTYEILQDLIGGIRSGLTYTGARNLDLFNRNALFIEVTANGHLEGKPHGAN